uniref:MBD domain-containing protein n=1 Tax=Strongyloides venezuelensis TaxID=75913 RepID=A0A0K0F6I1_STRVS
MFNKNTHSTTTGSKNLSSNSQILSSIDNNSVLFNNLFLGSGDYSNMKNLMSSTKSTIASTDNIERLPMIKTSSKNDGIDGYKIYSRSSMVEIAWQYDFKQWKEILGQNPDNNFGILLTLQKEKNTNSSNSIVESINSGYTNDFNDNSLYSEYLQKNNPYVRNNKKISNDKSLNYSSSIPLSHNNFYTPYELQNETFINKKSCNTRVYHNSNIRTKEFPVPKISLSVHGSQYSLPIPKTHKAPEMKNLWNSAYCGLLSNESETDESNLYKMFLDNLIKKMSNKAHRVSGGKKINSQSTTILTLSDIENTSPTYTREEMIKISNRYTVKQWKNYVTKNFSNNDVIMKDLGKEIFVVDRNPMRPKMSKEVKAIFAKHKGKGGYGCRKV